MIADKTKKCCAEPARMLNKTSGTKGINFETYLVDDVQNIIGVKITSEDGVPYNKLNEDAGNNIAVAMDVLTGLNLPVGTKFHISIDFDTEG